VPYRGGPRAYHSRTSNHGRRLSPRPLIHASWLRSRRTSRRRIRRAAAWRRYLCQRVAAGMTASAVAAGWPVASLAVASDIPAADREMSRATTAGTSLFLRVSWIIGGSALLLRVNRLFV
jgi:hypothetical protein